MTWIIYWADILPKIGFFCIMFSILLEIFGVVLLCMSEGKNFKAPIYAWICGLLLLIVGLFIPSKEAIYRMYAIDKLEEGIENNADIIKQIPHKSIKCLNEWLDNQLKEDK